jgi:hypothetical protein
MLIVFASNLTLMAYNGAETTIATDPVAIGHNNQAMGITTVAQLFNPGSNGLGWKMQVSNDGRSWLDQGPNEFSILSASGVPSLQVQAAVSGAYARLLIRYDAAISMVGAVTLTIQVNFSR